MFKTPCIWWLCNQSTKGYGNKIYGKATKLKIKTCLHIVVNKAALVSTLFLHCLSFVQVCPRSKVPRYLCQFPGGRSRSRDTGPFFSPDRGGGIEAVSRSCP